MCRACYGLNLRFHGCHLDIIGVWSRTGDIHSSAGSRYHSSSLRLRFKANIAISKSQAQRHSHLFSSAFVSVLNFLLQYWLSVDFEHLAFVVVWGVGTHWQIDPNLCNCCSAYPLAAFCTVWYLHPLFAHDVGVCLLSLAFFCSFFILSHRDGS